jgi:quercetin dioxygenase-like cupin family protein
MTRLLTGGMHMRRFSTAAALIAGSTMALAAVPQAPAGTARGTNPRAAVVIDNARVRALRSTGGSLAGVDHGPGVVVSIEDGPGRKAGSAVWMDDVSRPPQTKGVDRGLIVIIQPREAGTPPPPPAANGSKPGDAPFIGMSFKPLFENRLVSVLRARMDVGASEAFHTHGSDTLVVHLSGGEIEDTAEGKTTVNRWKPGDVEFEARGSSHSARNPGKAVDVVLVALK